MTIDVRCECGFSLSKLDAEHDVLPLANAPNSEVALSCPLCGGDIGIRLQALGILERRREGRHESFVRWKLPGATQAGSAVALGRFRLRFSALGSIEPREICYSRVPIFQTETGTLQVPLLPVKREFFDCIDQDGLNRLRDAGQLGRLTSGEYVFKLPLRGADGALDEMRLPVFVHKSGNVEEKTIRDVNLRIWPNIPFAGWKHYLIGLSAIGAGAAPLIGDYRRLRLYARGAVGHDFLPMRTVQRAGESIVGLLRERPTWLAIELTQEARGSDEAAEAIAGGLFEVATIEHRRAPAEWQIGLDFGTSNTCLAVKEPSSEKPQLVPSVEERDWSLYVIRAGAEPRNHKAPDLWPAPTGFGVWHDLFPSELLFGVPTGQMTERLEQINEWEFGIDYGISAPAVKPAYPEADYLLSEFKWKDALSGTDFARKVSMLQAKYLTGVMLSAYARTAISWQRAATAVKVKWSFPMSFDKDDVTTLRQAINEHVRRAIEAKIDGQWSYACPATESEAAARSAPSSDQIQVYVDMGGGSTDIAVKYRDFESEDTVYITSVRYAGSSLLAAFEGENPRTSCLTAGASLESLRRAVREAPSASDVLKDPRLFDQDKDKVTANRTWHFYGYLLELIARMLAAGIIDRRFTSLGSDGRTRRFPPELRTRVFFLGNGWRFYATCSPAFKADLEQKLKERVAQLLKEFLGTKTAYATRLLDEVKGVKLKIEHRDVEGVPHDKAAVAYGLLAEGSNGAEPEGSKPQGIVGWTTKVTSREGSREVPWFAKFDVASGEPPRHTDLASSADSDDGLVLGDLQTPTTPETDGPGAWYQPLNQPRRLAWDDAAPKFPWALRSIGLMKREFEDALAVVHDRCSATNNSWFLAGPYDVLLEVLFRKVLRKIGAGA